MKIKTSNIVFGILILNSFGINKTAQAEPEKALKNNPSFALFYAKAKVGSNKLTSFIKSTPAPVQFKIFENDFNDLAMLSSNPDLARTLIDNLNYIIENHEIKAYEVQLDKRTIIPIHEQKPFKLNLILDRGRLSRILAYIKSAGTPKQSASMLDYCKNACYKLLDFLSFRITYECILEEKDLNPNKVYYLSEFVYNHKELGPLIEDPTSYGLLNLVKKDRISWRKLFDISIHLPRLRSS